MDKSQGDNDITAKKMKQLHKEIKKNQERKSPRRQEGISGKKVNQQCQILLTYQVKQEHA